MKIIDEIPYISWILGVCTIPISIFIKFPISTFIICGIILIQILLLRILLRIIDYTY